MSKLGRNFGLASTAIALMLGGLLFGRGAAASTARTVDKGLEFSLHKIGVGAGGPTLLVIGGIQGDEPGGFNAASLLVTHYQIERGAVWVVPNLNFESIIRRSRGVHGDMNRKFPAVHPSDPDYHRLEKIKAIITAPGVSYVFNLHDGSGFFSPTSIDRNRNPHRWGQSIIIDQERVRLARFGEIGAMARQVVATVNHDIDVRGHHYHVKNTRTREGNLEMAKTLTYFAINNGKPAVGVEASKSLRTHERVFYHLTVLEAYMRELGLTYSRSFTLEPTVVKAVVDNNVKVSLYDNRIFFDMSNARDRLNYVPLKTRHALEFRASSPLVTITGAGEHYRVRYGNRRVTDLRPQHFEYDNSLGEISLLLDGERRSVKFGSLVEVASDFEVIGQEGYRTNVIGWRRKGLRDEADQRIRRREIVSRFSVDKQGSVFRVEVYRGSRFCGMVLVRFVDKPRSDLVSLSGPAN